MTRDKRCMKLALDICNQHRNKAMKRVVIYRQRGAMLAEAACSFALIFPLLILVIFVTIEASYAYTIGSNMNQAASLAARALAVYYQTNPEVVTNTSQQQAIFSNIRIPNMVSGNNQFSIPSGGWNLTSSPPTVTVIVQYLPGQGSPPLAPFPNPDPLNLGSAFVISVPATYRLQ